MDAPNLDVWIEAQQPPVLQQMEALRAGDDFIPRPPEKQGSSDAPQNDGEASGSANLTGGHIRFDAIREAAFSYAAQTALAWRYEQLRKLTQSQEGTIDVIASFAPFVVDDHMLLPSITRVKNRFDLSSDKDQLRSVDVQYQVAEEPRAITQPPTWRDYLWRDFPYPDKPHPALMPETASEIKIWESAIAAGWKAGLRQAENSWENNLNKLVRDIRGRITYRILESRNVVRPPQMVAGIPQMTTADGGKILNAGEVIHSITVPMSFNDQSQWGALWLPPASAQPQFEDPDNQSPVAGEPVFKKE
ncbi:hypothetical protein EZI54_07300 [Marinobacter halodurans]|uniref:Type IV secretion system protein DotC n=1 Tax=Marinobacter halodurans TaxID=2528979 RepID=A0ABY1ZPG2_9GAMM|nr:type IV secretory system conjugative DNA transfer family protein [Marinobacter halodurans]TBW57458.1 hypothetical protein EZI54_07300 [Marinobacter halodurans]